MKVHQLSGILSTALADLGACLLLAYVNEGLAEAVAIVDVVATAAPGPLSVQRLGSGVTAASTVGQLAITTGPCNGVHYAGGGDGVRKGRFSAGCKQEKKTSKFKQCSIISPDDTELTNVEDVPKNGGVIDSGAVPALALELVLALVDAQPGPEANVRYVVLVEVAQLRLPLGEALQLRTGDDLLDLVGGGV